MEHRKLGKSDIEVSAVGLGAWAIGGWMWGGTDEQEAIQGIHAALDAGVNLIDTAAIYGFGLSEEIVGKAIAGRRDQVVLATKCGLRWDFAEGEVFFTSEGKDIHKYLGAASIRQELEDSLRRLDTDRIDLYQTHWQEDITPRAETMGALLDLQREGKIRAIGVSNINVAQLKEYREAGAVDSAQERYSMLDQRLEAELLPYFRDQGVSLLAYSPLEMGLLTGKIGPDREFNEGDSRKESPRFSIESRRRVAGLLEAFQPVADAHDATLAQIAIAWTAARPGVTCVLCGARNARQGRENARAGEIVLSVEETALMDQAIAGFGEPLPDWR